MWRIERDQAGTRSLHKLCALEICWRPQYAHRITSGPLLATPPSPLSLISPTPPLSLYFFFFVHQLLFFPPQIPLPRKGLSHGVLPRLWTWGTFQKMTTSSAIFLLKSSALALCRCLFIRWTRLGDFPRPTLGFCWRWFDASSLQKDLSSMSSSRL